MSTARVPLFHCITDGIRISARPAWIPERSHPAGGHYVFAYRIRIENCGAQAAQLITRRWHIHDDGAGDTVVEGFGHGL